MTSPVWGGVDKGSPCVSKLLGFLFLLLLLLLSLKKTKKNGGTICSKIYVEDFFL